MFTGRKHSLVLLFLAGVVFGGNGDAPVSLQRTTARLTTSAFDESEMRRFFEQIFSQRRGARGQVAGYGLISAELERPALTEKNRLSALLHWESDLVCSESDVGAYVFGSSQPKSPWAVFLNGQFCGGWQSGTPNEVQLAEGIHRLQFLAVQNNGASVPGFIVMKKEGDALKEHALTLRALPEPAFVRLETAPADLQKYVAGWQINGRYHFLTTDQYLDCYQKSDETALLEGECFYRSIDSRRQPLPVFGELFVDGRKGMSLEWEGSAQKEVFAAAPAWPLAVPVHVRLSLGVAPLILSAKEPLNIQIHQTWPEVMPDALKAAWQLRCRQYDAKGVLLFDELVSTEYQPELKCNLTLASSVHLLSWQPEIGGIPAAKAVELQIVRPGNFPENPEIRGNQLLVSGRRAVLQCDPLRARASGGQMKRAVPEVPVKLYYFDDGLGNTRSENKRVADSSRATRLFQQMKGFSAGRILLQEIPGAEPELKSIAAFASLLNMCPEVAVLNLGERELKAGRKPLAWCRQLLFYAQASLAAGIKPVLLAYPEMPGIDPAVSRQTALLTKELGLTLNIPVVDLYSQRIIEEVDTAIWFEDTVAGHQAVSRLGKQWLVDKVMEVIRQ
ncbi:MAG: hypothetical protein PHY82_08455 [Lentisphaeria bacterium]|nr:hypothetical protein [Lentisphaeria bacterium]